MVLSALPVSKAMLGIGAAGVMGVTAAGVGIYKLASTSQSRNMPRCRIFFYEGSERQETFKETTLEALKAKSYANDSRFIDEDVKVACESTNLTEKPHYKWRVYVTETTKNGSTEGVYSKDKQRTLGVQHDSTIDKPQG